MGVTLRADVGQLGNHYRCMDCAYRKLYRLVRSSSSLEDKQQKSIASFLGLSMENGHCQKPEEIKKENWFKRHKWLTFVVLGIIVFFLIAEHRQHILFVLPYLPFLIILACPLLHIFMHGKHKHHEKSDKENER